MTLPKRLGGPALFGVAVGACAFGVSAALSYFARGWYREAVVIMTFLPPVVGVVFGWKAMNYASHRVSLKLGFERVAGEYLLALGVSAALGLVVAPLAMFAFLGRGGWLWLSPLVGWLLFDTLLTAAENHERYGALGRWIRGRRPLEKSERLVGATNPLTPATAIFWGGRRVPEGKEFGNFMVVGVPGSGKSVTINLLLRSIVARVRKGTARALVYDGKTEVISALKALGLPSKSIVILHPFDGRGSAWSIGKDFTNPGEVQDLSILLFPPDRTNQPFFDKAAADILQGVILSLIEKKGKRWTLRDIVLSFESPTRVRRVLELSPQNVGRRHYFRVKRAMMDVLMTARSKIRRYEVVAAHWWRAQQAGRTFSFEEWITGGGVLVLGNSYRATDAVNGINRVLFHRMSHVLLGRQARQMPTWLVLDELSKAGKFERLDYLMTTGRSKEVSIVLGFQDISGLQVEDAYGKGLAEEITSMVANKAVFRLRGAHTAKWAEEFFGAEDAIETRHSTGGVPGTAQDRQSRPIVSASELLAIPEMGPNGLKGVWSGAGTSDIWEAWIPMDVIRRNPLPDPAVDFVPAPEEAEVLPPWSDAELRELGLDEQEEEESSEPTEAPPPKESADPFGAEGDKLDYMP